MTGLPIPEEWGGSGLDAVDTMLVVEALGKGCEDGGLVFSLCAHMFASAVPIWRSGSRRDPRALPARIATGQAICANGTTEPEAGSDVYAMKTTARRDGKDYVIDGTKCFITNAPVADLFLIYATTDPAARLSGYLGLHRPAGHAGAAGRARAQQDRAPHLAVGHRLPRGVPGAEARGSAPRARAPCLFGDSMIWERGCLFAYYVGAMDRTLQECIEHARTRRAVRQRASDASSRCRTGSST